VSAIKWWAFAISPDGSNVLGRDNAGRITRYPLDGGAPEPIAGLHTDDVPVTWTPDGRALLVAHGAARPWIVDRLDPASGRREQVLEIRPRESAGLRLTIIAVSPNARFYVHSYSRVLSALYVVDGLH